MPFVKIAKDKYRSPSGKIYTEAQVRLYYANGGKFPDKPKVRFKKGKK